MKRNVHTVHAEYRSLVCGSDVQMITQELSTEEEIWFKIF